MKKLSLIGLRSELNMILDCLHYLNCVEIRRTEDVEGTYRIKDTRRVFDTENKISKIDSAIETVNEAVSLRAMRAKKDKSDAFEKPKKPFFFCRRDVSFEEFRLISGSEMELMAVIESVEQLKNRLTDLKAEAGRCENAVGQLKIYEDIQLAFSRFKGTKNTVIAIGQIPLAMCPLFADKVIKSEKCYAEVLSKNQSTAVVSAVYLKEDKAAIDALLGECGFATCNYDYDVPARVKIGQLTARLAEIEEECGDCVKKQSEYLKSLDDLKLLHDYFKVEKAKAEGELGFAATDTTFVLQAWCPENTVASVYNTIRGRTDAAVMFFDDPKEGDEVPSLLRNVKLVSAYEGVTNLYSPPRYKEQDPNLFLGIFFFIFFGLMLSDAGYGLILAIGTIVIMRLFKLETPMKKLLMVICMGGVSTIIWGAVLGTWFGFDVTDVPVLKAFVWFNPIENPVLMLIVCLLLGVVQILFGMGIKAVSLIRQGKFWDAVFDVFSWYLFFIGIGLLILPMAFPAMPGVLTTVGLCVAGGGLLIVMLTNGRHKKGILGKITGGFGGLYNIMNYLGDILSYSRLFGLGIATGIIGFAMNILAGLLVGNWFTVPFAVIVFLVGHTFNLSINVLGAYIHNSRLQFIEFFGKFYEGGGEDFRPLGFDTEYVKIK